MQTEKYTTQIPCEFKTEDGILHELKASDIQNISTQPLFDNWIPKNKIEDVEKYLLNSGFKRPELAYPEGETFGLTRSLDQVWELHIRAFPDGSIIPHVEVNRQFFEHLGDNRLFVAYEAYEFYRPVVNKFYLRYIPDNSYITSIIENFDISIPTPSNITPWKPIVAGLGIAAIIGLAAYYLSKPPKGRSR